MKLDIRVDPITNKIIEAKFKTFGCGSAIASSSYLTTLVHGKTLDDAVAIKNSDIASELCLPPVKSKPFFLVSLFLLVHSLTVVNSALFHVG